MYLETLQPFRKSGSIQNEINNLLNNFFGGPIHSGPRIGGWLPQADITETADKIIITAELPGLNKKDIELDISGNLLTIKGEKKLQEEETDENHYLGERYYGSFHRTFQLPTDVQDEEVEATFSRGILKISISKVKEAIIRKIEIKS